MVDSVDLKDVLEGNRDFVDVQWAEDEFCVVFKSKILFFDVKMKLLGTNSSYDFKSVCYRERYNLFVCATNNRIVFIKSNGLEHGDHIELDTDIVSLIGDNILLCFKGNDSTTVNVLYCKNFHWYQKQSIVLPGKLSEIENNKIYMEVGLDLVEYVVIREIDSFNNIYYVLDGCKVLYSDLNCSKIPPPLSKYNINFKKQIMSLDVQDGCMLVHLTDKIMKFGGNLQLKDVYECGKDGIPLNIDFCVSFKDSILMFSEAKVFSYRNNNIQEMSVEGLVHMQYKIFTFYRQRIFIIAL